MIFKRNNGLILALRISRNYSSKKIRNVGIIAHIDAGKTTLTERMLYYSGFLKSMGEVHTGDTVMDHMEQEKERGITITSAAITFPWKDYHVNLVDTPGHVDFTIEVERALRVLDGGVVLLDGSAGVEAQTMTVWRQAQRNKVPCIAFINKLDKPNADLEMTLNSMQAKLGLDPILTQIPYGSDIVDLVDFERLNFDNDSKGAQMTRTKVEDDELMLKRHEMIERLGDYDDCIAEKVINEEEVKNEDIKKALRKIVSGSKALVTFCGSAYKNYGVQPLMDAITDYIPDPSSVKHHEFLKKLRPEKDLCAMAFKIIHHPNKGVLTFVRIYNGVLKEGDSIFNITRDVSEKVTRIAIAYSNDFKQVTEVGPGNIAVISGLKETITGDTLVTSQNFAKKHPELLLAGVSVPDPVFFCSIEPPSMSKQKQLEIALEKLSREDPSLGVEYNEESDQIILSGMGELHLEVLLQRIRKEHKIDADLGPLMVAYKECPSANARCFVDFERNISGSLHRAKLELSVEPLPSIGDKCQFKISNLKADRDHVEHLRPWQLKALKKGFQNSIVNGPLLGYPVLGASFVLHSAEIKKNTAEPIISAALRQVVKDVLKEANICLMEPMMKLIINLEKEVEFILIQDLIMKRGEILERNEGKVMTTITASVPLSELKGYSTHIRVLTSGKAFFGMEFSHYELMDKTEQNKAIKAVTGFDPR